MPPSEQKKYDYQKFRIALLEEIIGSFSSRARTTGRPRSLEHQQTLRFDKSHLHLVINTGTERDCVFFCKKAREVAGLKRGKGTRHESSFTCSACKVHLCVASNQNCFYKYHKEKQYWE